MTARELTDQERARLAELDETIAKFEAQKRWSDVIKTILAKVEVVVSVEDKIALYAQAGAMYVEKSSNQAEAIKCFEAVLELDEANVEAISQLTEMYTKRRDWEKLVRVMEREAALLDPSDRGLRYVEIAQLATEKLRKPEICIDLWQKVVEVDPTQPEALSALASLYERAREWKPLADVLEKQSEQLDGDDLKQLLAKLGMIYADKLSDDAGAVNAFQRLLVLDPDDKRAHEQLKRRYVALKAWDDLEAFYAPSGKWDELVRTLDREASNKDAPKEEQIDLQFRIARLWQMQDKADRAARAYEKVLELDPDNDAAAVALSPIYEAAGDAKKLAGVYEVRLHHLTDTEEHILLLRETGVLYEERLKKPDVAFEKYLAALALDPMRDVLREDVNRLAGGVNGWERVIATYTAAIEERADVEAQLDLRLSLGAVLRSVGRIDDAIAQYDQVQAADPGNLAAIEALDGLYRETSRFAELLDIYDRRLDLETDPSVRKAIAYGRASLLEGELSSPDAAISAYQAILEEWGDEEEAAYRALDVLFEKQERWGDLAQTLERRIDLGPSSEEELAALKYRLARVLEQHLDDKPRALDLLREVVTLIPEHEGARATLEGFLDLPEIGVSAAQILEPLYEMQGDWEALVRTLEVLAAAAESPERKLEILSKIGEVCGAQLGDQRRAFEAFGRALRELPEHPETIEHLESIAEARSWWPDLVALTTSLATAAGDPDVARRLWIRAARAHDLRLGATDAAVGAYEQVLARDPSDGEVLDALEELFLRTGRHRDLIGVLRRKADATSDAEEKEALLARVADVHETVLEEPEGAISVYREILDLDPTSARGLVALDRLYEKQAMWSDLADNVQRQLTLAGSSDEETRLMLRLASLRETHMGATDAAIEIYREVLSRDASNEEAISALERLISDAAHQLLITEILEPIYRDSNEFASLIRVLEIQTTHASSPERRVELLHRIAELYEIALDDTSHAFDSYARALAEDPANTTTQEQLERLASATGDFEGLAKVYEARAAALSAAAAPSEGAEATPGDDLALANTLLTKAADVREVQLGDAASAIAHHRRILELDPNHLDAASALERLYQSSEQYEPLAQILLRKAEMLDAPEEQKEHLFRAAAIYEEILERPTAAIDVYQKVLEVDREDLEALDKLIELNLKLERWPELLAVYTQKADVVVDPDEKKRLFVEVGAVYEHELADPAKAVDTYQRILEIDPDDLPAIQRLDGLYQAGEQWQELRQILEREADLASDPNEIISYRFRIADLLHHQLADASKAVEGYGEILDVVPDHQPTLDALEAMIREGKEALRAATTLEPVYQQFGEWQKLVAVIEVEVAHEEDPARKVELLHRIAELCETQIEDAQRAFDAYARALPFESQNEHTLGSLERLATELDAFPRVTSLYDAELDKLGERPDELIELGLRVAQLYEVQVGDVESAIARYNRVLAADETNEPAIEALDRLYEATEKWNELAAILARRAQIATSPDSVLDLQYRLGQTYQSHLGQVDLAIEQYKEILAAAPEHESALAALEQLFEAGTAPLAIAQILEPLYRMSEAWEKLVGVYQVELEQVSEPAERMTMIHRIAEIAEDRASEPQIAYEWHLRALLEDPADEQSIADSERLAGALGNWEPFADTLATIAAKQADASTRAVVGHRLARIYEEELGDVERAASTYLFVLASTPSDTEALEALDRIYVDNGAAEALQEILQKRIDATEDARDKVELSFRRAQALENDLGRTDEATRVYLGILDGLDAEHEPSITALENIYTEQQDWANLDKTFDRELAVALGDAGRADVLAKKARLTESYLKNEPKAAEIWGQVLELRGEDQEALNALGDLYARAGRFEDLVAILDREAAISDDDEMRAAIFADLGRVWYGKLGNPRNAIDNWQRVLDIDPTHTGALFALIEIHRTAGEVQELVDCLHRVIEVGAATLDDATIETCYMELGALYEGTLEQPADAIDAYTKALDVNPGNFAAMDALERLYAANADWEAQIEIFERRAEALDDPEAKVQTLLTIAKTWADPAEQPDRGTSAYQRVLTIQPTHVEAFAEIEKLHEAAGRWEELSELYMSRYENTDDVPGRVALLQKLAGVQEQHLDSKEEAFQALQLAWEEDYTNPDTAELERVAGLTQKWNDLLGAANAALKQATDPAQKIAICLACAKWYGSALGRPEYAIPYYQQILALDPANVPATRQMADLYRSTQQWETLKQVLGRLVDITSDASEKARVYVELGDLAATHLGTPEQSRGHYQQALDTDPRSIGALEALERVYQESGEWPALLDVLRRKADALETPEEVLQAKLQIAEAYEVRTGDLDEAVATYRQVLDTDPMNLRALKGLERLYAQREQWQELLEVLEKQYECVSTEKERIQILLRVAAMWEEEFVKPEKAAERLEAVIEIDPSNDAAYRALERIYRGLQRWERLIETYERHVSSTPDRTEKQQLLAAIGDVYNAELHDPDRAVDAYLNITAINPDNVTALDALTRIYDKRGDHSQALDTMMHLAKLLHDPQAVVDLRYRIGRLLDVHIGDRVSAVEQYQSALDVEPGHLPSLEAMRKIHLDGGDWLAAARTLEQEAQHQAQPRLVSRLLVDLGRLYEDKLDEHERAIACFRAAFQQDEDNEDAALPLAEEAMRSEDFESAKPLLDMLVKRSGKREPEEQQRLAFMLGEAARKTNDNEAAIKALSKAHQIDQHHLPTLFALSGAYYAAQNWDQAQRYYQLLLIRNEELNGEQRTDIQYHLGVIKREQGDRRKALNMFDRALDETPTHRPTLEAMVGLYESQNDWEQVIHYKKRILDLVEGDERFKMLEEIGDLWSEKVKNSSKAVEAYYDALEMRPKTHKLLHKILILHQSTKQWDSAIEVIERIAALVDEQSASEEARNAQKAKYKYTIGVILRDEVKDLDRALAELDAALGLDPSQLKAFEAINKILNGRKDWKQLERAFRKMIHRVSGKTFPGNENRELEHTLWHNLGVIYRDRMHQADHAVESFKMASQIRPDSEQEHQILAELYATIPGRLEDAIVEQQWLLRQDPYRIEAYQALYRLYFEARQYDKAWCLASTLTFLKKADQEQQQFFEQYRVRGPIRPTSRLDDELWLKHLAHADADLVVSKIFSQVWPAILSMRGQSDREAGLAAKYQVDPATHTGAFPRTFGFVAQVLGLPAPRLFLRQDVAGGLTHLRVFPLASLCGSTLLTGFQPLDLMFIAARHLTDYRPEFYIRTLLPSNMELKAVLMGALRLANLVPGDAQTDQTAQEIRKYLQAPQIDAVGTLGRRFMQAGARTDIKKWLQGVEITACRAGFLVSNDLETSARMVQALGATGPVDLPAKEKIKELVLFSVSEEYFRLRDALGIKIALS